MAKAALEIQDLGLLPYADAHALQQDLVGRRARGLIPDRLLLLEHPSVYTLGRKADPSSVGQTGEIQVVSVERGGEITFHEPGQLVAYPIFLLNDGRRDIRVFLHGLEQVLIDCLAGLGVQGERDARNTGVWVEGRKVASIGIAVRRWVTWHGLALNVNNDLALAQAIRPCGFAPELMTSLQQLLGAPVALEPVKAALARQFRAWWDADD